MAEAQRQAAELAMEQEIFDEIEAIMNSEEASDAEFYAELEQIREELNIEAEQRRQQLEEEGKQKIFEEINEVLEASDSYKPAYNALSSDLIKQMLKTRIKMILSNNSLSVKTRIEDAISIFKNFRKIYTKGSFNKETGSYLEKLFFDPNIAVGIHRAGLTDGQLIVDEGLKITGDMSSGSFDINQAHLSKNISFFSQSNLISYLGFLNSINTAHNYKTYGADNADVVIFAFPKDAIIDYENANLSKYPDLVIQDENGNYAVNPEYILGYVNDNNGVVSDIKLNKNYTGDSSGDIYITQRDDIEVLDDVNNLIDENLVDNLKHRLNELAKAKQMTLKELGEQEKLEIFLTDLQEEANILANEINNTAIKSEPQITADMLLLEREGIAYLTGLEYRLKSLESLKRKIISDSKGTNLSLKSAAQNIGDSVRYTLICNSEHMVLEVADSLNKLLSKDYKILKFKNTFDNEVYKGINVNLESPNGVKFELQYHTEQSFKIKNELNHLYYEIFRNDFTTVEEKQLAMQIMKFNTAKIIIPEGIQELTKDMYIKN